MRKSIHDPGYILLALCRLNTIMSVTGLMVYYATLSSNTEECILLINYFDPYPTVHMKIDDYISSDDVEWALYGGGGGGEYAISAIYGSKGMRKIVAFQWSNC